MNRRQLIENIWNKDSFLCIGLDSDIRKIPEHLLNRPDPVFEFNRQIIEATHDLCVAYKPNIAFYESAGVKGWETLRKTMESIPSGLFTIADAKRGDIGNTSEMYARAFYEQYNFDSVTVAPYMGYDSVQPFLKFKDKWVILLALTSNPGATDFQLSALADGSTLYQQVIRKSMEWASCENMMYVAGATRAIMLTELRKIIPDHFLLIPGIGTQGGDLKEVCQRGMNNDVGILVNASRSILYADSGEYFADKAREEALKLQVQMRALLK
ncbi:MAG: orotidine-5'-phosphate decarboxylase [Bacteroidia bacterium]|nr:orotidine-5'-phosphate decarboxylase [Bacteroidia bacterium]MCZ2277436.1 orotidine-5'-phosphate decarboxylase [Bacteroidia bacterium]